MKYIGSLDDNFGRSLLFGNVTGIIMVGFIGWSAWAMIQDLLSMLWVIFAFLILGIIFGMYNPSGFGLTYQIAPDARVMGFPYPACFLEKDNGDWIDFPFGQGIFLNMLYRTLVFLSGSFCCLWVYILFVA